MDLGGGRERWGGDGERERETEREKEEEEKKKEAEKMWRKKARREEPQPRSSGTELTKPTGVWILLKEAAKSVSSLLSLPSGARTRKAETQAQPLRKDGAERVHGP